jgi:hypothetical protein
VGRLDGIGKEVTYGHDLHTRRGILAATQPMIRLGLLLVGLLSSMQ